MQSEEAEARDLSITMMGKKTKRLYSRMQHGLTKKAEELERLTEKRRRIDEQEQEEAGEEVAVVGTRKSKRGKR